MLCLNIMIHLSKIIFLKTSKILFKKRFSTNIFCSKNVSKPKSNKIAQNSLTEHFLEDIPENGGETPTKISRFVIFVQIDLDNENFGINNRHVTKTQTDKKNIFAEFEKNFVCDASFTCCSICNFLSHIRMMCV